MLCLGRKQFASIRRPRNHQLHINASFLPYSTVRDSQRYNIAVTCRITKLPFKPIYSSGSLSSLEASLLSRTRLDRRVSPGFQFP